MDLYYSGPPWLPLCSLSSQISPTFRDLSSSMNYNLSLFCELGSPGLSAPENALISCGSPFHLCSLGRQWLYLPAILSHAQYHLLDDLDPLSIISLLFPSITHGTLLYLSYLIFTLIFAFLFGQKLNIFFIKFKLKLLISICN